MKQNKIFKLLLALFITAIMASCEDNVQPGLYLSDKVIETYPGDTIVVNGQVSNDAGISLVTIEVAEWGVKKEYVLESKHNKVFNYNYQLVVPQDAKFDTEMIIYVKDSKGNENKKMAILKYLPDSQAPEINPALGDQVAIDFEDGHGAWKLNWTVTDDRALKSIRVMVPAVSYDRTFEVSGKTVNLDEEVEFTTIGSFPATVVVEDRDENVVTYTTTLNVIAPEVDNGFEDYGMIFIVDADENPDDYLYGYYLAMYREAAYQYSGKFYAPHDNYRIYLTSARVMDGDLIGLSPYSSAKMMNNNGYVVPIVIEKAGYYGLWVDLNERTFNTWELDTSEAYTGPLQASGCGFKDFGDWGVSGNMTRNGFVYTIVLTQNGAYTGTRQYYAADTSNWKYIIRYSRSNTWEGWWEDKSNSGGSVGDYESDYDGKVLFTMNTGILWATLKKVE